MRRYYFHVRLGQVTVLDQEGIELADTTDAENEAVRRAQQIAAGKALKGVLIGGMVIVADDYWQRLFELPF
jgi:hypothetical protein